MSKIRLFLKEKIAPDLRIRASKEQFHYLHNVMRITPKDDLFVFNGADGEWFCKLEGNFLVIKALSKKQTHNKKKICLCFAVPKLQALKNIVRQTTELGVDILQPIYTERTVAKIKNTKKLTLWAIEAAEQSCRNDIPKIQQPISLHDVFLNYCNIFMFDKSAHDKQSCIEKIAQLDSCTLLIGPEGGFSEQEKNLQCKKIHLGNNTLRCDTAASCAVFYFKHYLGYQNKHG